MIADGPRECWQCATVFEFADGAMAEVRWSANPCTGCTRWAGIWERARLLVKAKPSPPVEIATAVNLGSVEAILARLRRQHLDSLTPEHDWAKRAAGDVD